MHISFKEIFLAYYAYAIYYTHTRGQVRMGVLRQLMDHSSLMAPVNIVMYWFSKVPKTPFVNLDHFPELSVLKENWQIIRDEALALYEKGSIHASQSYDDIGFNSFFRRGWKRFYLKWYQDCLPSAKTTCPKTVALLNQIPSVNAAMFALLPKQSYLSKHRDPYAGSLRYHLGLVTPNSDNCHILVDGQTYSWRDGEAVLFDETYIHEAQNTSDEDRIILFCDIKRPLTNRLATAFNVFFSQTVMKASASKNVPTEKVGLINHLFKYIYKIRLVGKKLKAFNKPFYYTVKYALFAWIFYMIFI